MHELSIAQSIVDIVQQYVPDGQHRAVKSVRLKVGEQSGVVVDSLEFCFTAITMKTSLEGARLEIDRVPVNLHCRTCDGTFTNEIGVMQCPSCGGSEVILVSGTELQVVEIELHDEPEEVT